MRQVKAVRYVMPFREGSSVPALMEGDDLGLYLVKLRGAGQGPKALVSEVIAGELARHLGLEVPEIVLVDMPPELAASEPDPELCIALERSSGLNAGLDYLPGSITFDPIATPPPDARTASLVVLLDALVTNVDRTIRNPNLLWWHRRLWLIDHGASLYFHHGWSAENRLDGHADPFKEVRDHVLLPWATELSHAADHLQRALTGTVIAQTIAQVPSAWLEDRYADDNADELRVAYARWLVARLEQLPLWLGEAQRAHAQRV